MPNDACNPQNAMGKLAGIFDAGGVEATDGAINLLDDNAKMLFHQIRSQSAGQALAAGNKKAVSTAQKIIDDTTVALNDDTKDSILGGLHQLSKPTDFVPKEITDPVLDFIDDFFVQNHENLGKARGEFQQGIKRIIGGVDIESLPESIKGEVKHWFRDLKEGYPFYKQDGTMLTKAASNVVGNAIDLSGNIIFGNPFELLIKAPSLYGFTPTGKGIVEALKGAKGNPWGRIPELDARGYYGFKKPETKNIGIKALRAYDKLMDVTMGITNTPLMNVAYGAGKVKTGSVQGGLEAVERIAFRNRLGNDPRLFRSQQTKSMLTFMNYTFNTYHMVGGMAKGLFTEGKRLDSARGMATYIGLTMAVGGGAAIIPKPLGALFEKIEGYKEWEQENLTPIGDLIRPGAMSFGIGASMLNRAVDGFGKGIASGGAKFWEGDIQGGALDIAEAGLVLSSTFARTPLGNPRIQKSLKQTRKMFEGDLSGDEFSVEMRDTWLPFLKEAK